MNRMKERLFVATFSENAIEEIKQYGLNIEFDHLCISENLDEEKIEQTLSDMRRDWRCASAVRAIIHGPYTEINASSVDPKVLRLTKERYEAAYRVCRELGVNHMVVHSGFIPILYYKEWHREKSAVFWKEFMSDKPEDFHLYIENVFEDEPYLLKNIIEETGDARVRMCLDVGHANACSGKEYTVLDWIRELGGLIGHVHLHNNFGVKDEHNSVFDGTMDMEKVMETIHKYCGQEVTLTIESQTCRESILWLLEKFMEPTGETTEK